MSTKGFFRRRWAVVVARRRNAAAAGLIGARRGTLVDERRSGGAGLAGLPTLVIRTLRPGSADATLREQIDVAVAAGYRRPPVPPTGYGAGRLFPATPGLPMLSVEVVAEGGCFRGVDAPVPTGRTGVVVTLYAGS
jgi:hypothetical protein